MTNNIRGTGAAIATLNPLEDPSWDERLGTRAGATFFHSSAWLNVLRDTYGLLPMFFASREAGQEVVFPLMEANSWLTGRRAVGLPFTDECAPLGDASGNREQAFSAICDHGRSRGWRYIECRGGRAGLGAAPASTSFWGHTLDLRKKETELFAGLEASGRRAVRKAEQGNLTITMSCELEDLKTFYVLLGKTRRRHGVPVQPFDFFGNIHRHILAQQKGRVVLARQGSDAIAGAVFFHFGGSTIYKFGASDETRQNLRANNLVMWEAIKWHAQKGFEYLDFGRTSLSNEGLRKFKLGWGTAERTIDYVRYDLRSNAFVTVPDAAAGWHNGIFRLLPVSLSRLAGSLLYRHVA